MFKIGDKVVCPTQGIGVISTILNREFKGESIRYYEINIQNTTMKMTIPVERANNSHIRLVSNYDDIQSKLNTIQDYFIEYDEIKKSSVKERIEENNRRIKEGTLNDYLGVICDLTQISKNATLNATDKQALSAAKKILIVEIAAAKDISADEAETLLDSALSIS